MGKRKYPGKTRQHWLAEVLSITSANSCLESTQRPSKALLGGLCSPTHHPTQKGLPGPPPNTSWRMNWRSVSKDEASAQLKNTSLGQLPASGTGSRHGTWGHIQSSCVAVLGSCTGSSSSRLPAARTPGLMHLYLGTSLPEIGNLEQVQRVAANAIKSWSELGGEVERAKPARLAKPWQGPSCP